MTEFTPKSARAGLCLESVNRALSEYGIHASADQAQQVLSYLKLLLTWNEKINLTAIRDPLEVLYRHFCESMYAAAVLPLEKGRLADVGSGGGFPGLPLKIIQPELDVVLVESSVKKATFLAEVIREIALPGVRVLVSRYEDLGEEVAPLDFVCSRAVGDFDALLFWASSKRVHASHVILWIGGRDLETVLRNETWNWREPVAVPRSIRRYILVGDQRV